jgi:hypothetical protein
VCAIFSSYPEADGETSEVCGVFRKEGSAKIKRVSRNGAKLAKEEFFALLCTLAPLHEFFLTPRTLSYPF